MNDLDVARSTLRLLLSARRLVPILLVCLPMVVIQSTFSRDRLAVPLAIAMCIVFVLIAPLSWRLLFRAEIGRRQQAIRLIAYSAIGTGVVMLLGLLVPKLTGMGQTFLTGGRTIWVCLALYLVGGWGLGRDINHEEILEREKARSAALAREVERTHLLAIRSHFDPHFLFNALNAIAEWCREDGEVAEQAILQLASMLRFVLDGVRSASWPLNRELELTQNLFAMHLLRDPELFKLQVQADPRVRAVPVPPMILLPLAENAVKHGPAAGHRGDIVLAFREHESELLVTLENPGPYHGPRPGSDGLPTLRRRLELAYGGRARLNIEGAAARTVVEMVLPMSGPAPEAVA